MHIPPEGAHRIQDSIKYSPYAQDPVNIIQEKSMSYSPSKPQRENTSFYSNTDPNLTTQSKHGLPLPRAEEKQREQRILSQAEIIRASNFAEAKNRVPLANTRKPASISQRSPRADISQQSVDFVNQPSTSGRFAKERRDNDTGYAFELDQVSESSPPRNIMLDEPVNMANQLYSSGNSFYK